MTTRRVLITYACLSVALWPLPLLNIVHVEALAVVAFVAFFAAGWAALSQFNRRRSVSLGRVLARQEAALLVPLALLTFSLVWAPNCDYLRGLLFYGLFPGITVVLSVALAYAISGTGWRHQKLLLGGMGIAITVMGPLYDLGFHPQFYTYNHVFGGVLGPIYDEDLAIRTGLFTFRGLTLLWALLCVLIGRRLRGKRSTGYAEVGVILVIGACYLFAAPLGFNTPAWYLQQQLGGHQRTEHFDIYYDPTSLSDEDVEALAEDHEYRYGWLAGRLSMEGPGRIVSYLYPDAETKARLTGAGETSVAPVWLSTPQSHLLLERYGQSFGHELAHVFSRAFGLPILHASWAVGLVEGTAEALEPPDGRPGLHEQVAVAALKDTVLHGERLADEMAARLSPLGFWTGRSAVSYTTMGSFVRFLLDRYGPERLRRVYATANFEDVYGKSVYVLAGEWQQFLSELPFVARATEALVTRRFARPSLFEKRCPHYVPPYRRAFEAGQKALAAGDTSRAQARFEDALEHQPRFVDAHLALARLRLARSDVKAVIRQLDTLDVERPPAAVAFVLGDAYARQAQRDTAWHQYQRTLDRLPLYAHESRAQVALRMAVANRPDVVRVLTSADSAGVQAVRLAHLPGPTPAVMSWQALRHMEAGQYKKAMQRWRRIPAEIGGGLPSYLQHVVRRQRHLWEVQSALRMGRYDDAVAQARASAEAFRAVGAFNLAAVADDVARKAAWLRRRPRAGQEGSTDS